MSSRLVPWIIAAFAMAGVIVKAFRCPRRMEVHALSGRRIVGAVLMVAGISL